jgi:hypothetical protein
MFSLRFLEINDKYSDEPGMHPGELKERTAGKLPPVIFDGNSALVMCF